MLFILNRSLKVIDNLSISGDITKITPYYNDIFSRDLPTGAETFTFEIDANTSQSENIVVGNYIAFKDDIENSFKLLIITDTEEEHNTFNTKKVYCEMSSIELINNEIRPNKYVSVTVSSFLNSILAITNWKLGLVDASLTDVLDIDITDYTTVYEAIQDYVIGKFGAEIRYRVEMVSNVVVGKYIDVFAKRGKETGIVFSYTKNITEVTRKMNISDLATALIGVGKDNITFRDIETQDKPAGQDFVANEEAYKIWSKDGEHIFGVEKFDTDSPQELLKLTLKKLEERSEPKASYTVKVELLGEKVSIGDTVRIVDHDFNPPLYLEARVSQLKTSKTDPTNDEVILSNFREIGTNITEEMKSIAGKLEGYVDSQFPIGSDKIQDGAVNQDKIGQQAIYGTHIQANAISADHISADQIKAEHIQANSIAANHIQADQIMSKHIQADNILATHIKADEIKTEHLAAGSITADKAIIANAAIKSAQIASAQITNAHIVDGAIDNAKIENASINAAKIQDASIGTAQIADAAITNAKIGSLAVGTANIKDAAITNAKIGNLSADKITAGDISADRIKTNVITAINASIGTINSDKIVVGNLDAGKITTGSLDADRIKGNVITAINASIETATINAAKIGSLSADKITAGDISADRIKTNIITAINANVGSATISSAKIGNLDASKITTGSLSADRIAAGSITATKIHSDAISAIGISAGQIVSDKITSGEIKVTDANIIDGTINGAKITKASITNAQINDLFVADAYIKNLDAGKITTGSLNTTKVNMSSTSGQLTIADNTIQIKDTQATPKVRVQIGKDKLNNYGILVMNANGEAIFDSDKGILSSNGLNSNVVSTDKIVDGAVAPTKIQVDELWASEGFIGNFKAQEIEANKIINLQELDTTRLDIKGLISFEAFNPDLQASFTQSGDKTFINGGNILTGTLSAKQINTRGFTSSDNAGNTTFNIDEDTGKVSVSGQVESYDFDELSSYGYRLTPEGDAIFNNATVRGEFITAEGGISNYGAENGKLNLLENTNFVSLTTGSGTTSKNPNVYAENWGGYNAGITNPTTNYHAHIDTTTFKEPVYEYNESDGTRHWKGINQSKNLNTKLSANKQYVISFDAYATGDGTKAFGGFYYTKTGGTSTSFHAGQYNITDIEVGKWKRYTANVPIGSDIDLNKSVSFYIYGYGFTSNSILYIKNIKLEEGESSTPWTPATEDNLDFVRFWAGSDYNNRESAPFKVMSSGKIIATEGEFGGTFTGRLSIGNIHIQDTNDSKGAIDIKTANDAETKVHLEEDNSYIGSNLRIGTDFINFDVTSSILDVNGKLSLSNGDYSLLLNNGSNVLQTSDGTGSHTLRYNSGTYIFDAQGTNSYGDFLFKRTGSKTNVKVDGELNVTDKITSDKIKIDIVMKDDAGNSGFDYIVK